LASLPAEAYDGEEFPKLLSALGLRGDPVKVAASGSRSYGYPVFEGVNPNPRVYSEEMAGLWGRRPVGADLMAGGGSIPFEMARAGYGRVVAGEYNPIAYTILKGALEYPVRYKNRLVRDMEAYGRQLLRALRHRVKEYFPPHPAGQPLNYIWVRMFRCPQCGCEIPSLISLWLDREKGYALYPEVKGDRVELTVVKVVEVERRRESGKIESTVKVTDGPLEGRVFETRGYVHRGILECPKHRHTVDGDEVKRQYREYLRAREAEGYYGSHPTRLIAAVLKRRVYVDPTDEMREAYKRAEEDLRNKWELFSQEDLIPQSIIPLGQSTKHPLNYGIEKWYDLFNARQLLVHAEIVRLIKELREKVIEDEIRKGRTREEATDYSNAITTYLTLALGKTLDYNSVLTSWHQGRGIIRNTFQMHAFPFTWAYGEGDQLSNKTGYDWCLKNVHKSLRGIVKRLAPVNSDVEVVFCDAGTANFPYKIDILLTDPPYYDNIQYGELSDFFYVWFRKILGDVYPEAYREPETPKMGEAVANRVRHGSRKLAARAYEEKLKEIFANHHRILRDDGVLALWFAHKSGAAWSRTINALLDAGFTITAIWGVRTEMARSLHISGKAALQTNLILTCRKREGGAGYIQDAVREMEMGLEPRLEELEEYGLVGPDFLMAAQAEALKVASCLWPLRDPQGKMTASEILEYMMDQAVGHAINYLTRKVAPQIVGVDAPTKFYVLTRYLYGDLISYDDARRLALACLGATGVADPVHEIAVDTGLGRMATTQIGGESTRVLQLVNPWDRDRKGLISRGEDAPIIDHIHRAVALLEEGKSTMEAAEALAPAGEAACEVIRALYQILPERIKRGRSTVVNMERTHIQTLLLGVCQEGLHRVAQRRIEEERTQRRLHDFPTEQENPAQYDPILDQFLKENRKLVEIAVEGVDAEKVKTALTERINARGLSDKIRISLEEGKLYMERVG